MPGHCIDCGRKGTKSGSRAVNPQTNKCSECALPTDDVEGDNSAAVTSINADSMLSEISFRNFTQWFKGEVTEMISKKVDEATKDIKKEVDSVKKSAKTANDDIAGMKTQIESLKTSLKAVQDENKQLKTTCANNLKYLINSDRNSRRSNVMVLGLSEAEDLTIAENTAHGDKEKIDLLMNHIGIGSENVDIVSHSRLGKEGQEGVRPIKMTMKNGDMAKSVLSNASKLKTLNKKIFLKPDKSFKEREEFQRLLKKKEEAVLSHPSTDGQERVTLKNGSLKVDGVEIDSYKPPQTIF